MNWFHAKPDKWRANPPYTFPQNEKHDDPWAEWSTAVSQNTGKPALLLYVDAAFVNSRREREFFARVSQLAEISKELPFVPILDGGVDRVGKWWAVTRMPEDSARTIRERIEAGEEFTVEQACANIAEVTDALLWLRGKGARCGELDLDSVFLDDDHRVVRGWEDFLLPMLGPRGRLRRRKKTDSQALGRILAQMINGTADYDSRRAVELLSDHPAVPLEIRRLISNCLRRRRWRRPGLDKISTTLKSYELQRVWMNHTAGADVAEAAAAPAISNADPPAISWLTPGTSMPPQPAALGQATPVREWLPWVQQTYGMIDAPMSLRGDKELYVGSMDGCLYILDPVLGSHLRRVQTGDAILARPLYHDGHVFAASTDGLLYIVDRDDDDGAVRTLRIGGIGSSNLVIGAGGVHFAATDGTLVSIWPHDGTVSRATIGDAMGSTPVYAEGRIHVGTTAGLAAYEIAGDGLSHLWTTGDADLSGCWPVHVDGIIYSGGTNATNQPIVCALDAGTGRQRWTVPTRGLVAGEPAFAGSTLFCADDLGTVMALDAATGRQRWLTELPAGVDAGPTFHDDSVYVGCRDGRLYALDAADGGRLWKFATRGPITRTPPLVGNGFVYFGSADGHVYAIRDTGAGAAISNGAADIRLTL
ncbi:PQQ-binding-like beta-propeller repeat protein [Streptosporangiaceae bacterium NEAU-GS5]|nr:PQQ-binding-like beta-propeller repeat protein [Streptosporangiaceae bacterium NEAU-GS5]